MQGIPWKHVGITGVAFLCGWMLLASLNLFSSGLSCFVAFCISALHLLFSCDLLGSNAQWALHHNAALSALKARLWTVGEQHCRKALAAARSLRRKRAEALGGSGILLCMALQQQKKYLEAEQIARELLAAIGPPTKPSEAAAMGVALSFGALARACLSQGKLAEAEQATAQAAATSDAIWVRVTVTDLQSDLARHRGDYGTALASAQSFDELASVSNEKALHEDAPLALLSHALLYTEAFRPAPAIALAKQVIATFEERGERGVNLASAYLTLSHGLEGDLRLAEAEAAALESIRIFGRWLPPDDWRILLAWAHLAILRARLAQPAAAREALSFAERSAHVFHEEAMAILLYAQGECAFADGDLATAEGYLRSSVEREEKRLRPAHPILAPQLAALAATLEAQGRITEAEPLRGQLAAMREALSNVE